MAKKKASPETVASTETIESFKAFDSQLRCRDFQYEIGKTYKHDGKVGENGIAPNVWYTLNDAGEFEAVK